jgi:hypothetical protein
MNRFQIAVVVAVAAFASAAGGQAVKPACTPWRDLFDGKSNAGWRGFKKEAFPDKGWEVVEGCLHVKKGGGGGDIITAQQFADFEVRFEWKVAPGANSGIMYRVTEDEATPWRTGPEYQILDDEKHPDGRDAKTSAGSLYAIYAPEGKALKPVGEFNEARIVIYRNRVEHWLNGKRVVAYDLDGEEFKAKVKASKFSAMPAYGTRDRGHIALQDHGDDVWYRNIRIREFRPENEGRLFNGKNLEGWTFHLNEGGKMEDVWSATPDAVLVCKGNPIGYIRTTSDWTNFLLKLDWRFDPVTKKEGNSGVLFRMTGPDKVWPRSIEAQLHSKQAGDFWNIGDFNMKVDPARTRGRNTKALGVNENPVGDWNAYEIDVCGPDVELRVNGMVLNRAWEAEEVPGKICLQSEGAEIHFRNIRILPIGN